MVNNLSIREVLSDSKEIAEIADPSPLVTASLYRLLLAILQRSLDIRHFQDLHGIWSKGQWGRDKIDGYIDQWHDRFDLFDERWPFYQSPGFRKGDPITVNKLFNEMSATNNTILFDHRFDDAAPRMEAGAVARGLIATQAFALGGGRSATINLLHAPLVGKAVVILKGQNLFETLTLNLIPMANFSPLTLSGEASSEQLDADRPIWEADEPDEPGSTRPVKGYLDLLTWQPRAILLLPDDGSTTFSYMHMAQGTVSKSELIFDPMVSYFRSKEQGWRPLSIDVKKEPWRDLSALIQMTDESRGTMSLRSAGTLVRDEAIARQALYRLDVLGMSSDQAKIHQWKHARIPLPVSYLCNEVLVSYIAQAISVADQVEKDLYVGIRELATQLLYPVPGMRPDKNVVNQMVASFHAVPRYWSVLEIPFHSLINELNGSVSSGLDRENKILLRWSEITVKMAADKSLNEQIDSIDNNARGLRAAVMARRSYSMALVETLRSVRGKYVE